MNVRYTGKLPTREIKKNSKDKTNVLLWQKFINWYYGKNTLVEDGLFGTNTTRWTKNFQAKMFPHDKKEWDGIVGKKTIAKAKSATKFVPDGKKPYQGIYPDLNALAGDIVCDSAKDLAWAYGTKRSKYKYPSGSATPAFKVAIAKVYPKRGSWSKQCRLGASCDVFVGTVVRNSGHDSTFPRGLDDVREHISKYPNLYKVINRPSKSDLKKGDIVMWETASAGHIFVYVGDGKEAEANHNGKNYGHISKLYIPSSTKLYKVFRPIGGRKYLAKGDRGTQVGRLQAYLNWCLGLNLTVDNGFGDKTEAAVKAFQKKYALTPDGQFGSASLAKAKAVRK